MRIFFALILITCSIVGLVGACQQKASYVQGTAGRISDSFDALLSKREIENDELEITNDRLELQNDRREHKRNDGSKLKAAIAKAVADRLTADTASQKEAAQVPEDITGELAKAVGGLAAGILGIALLITERRKKLTN